MKASITCRWRIRYSAKIGVGIQLIRRYKLTQVLRLKELDIQVPFAQDKRGDVRRIAGHQPRGSRSWRPRSACEARAQRYRASAVGLISMRLPGNANAVTPTAVQAGKSFLMYSALISTVACRSSMSVW